MASRVTSKGQVTVPKRVRDALGLKEGTVIEFLVENGRAILEPVKDSSAQALAGSLKLYAQRRRGRSEDRLMEEVRQEVAREAAQEGLSARHKHPHQVPPRR